MDATRRWLWWGAIVLTIYAGLVWFSPLADGAEPKAMIVGPSESRPGDLVVVRTEGSVGKAFVGLHSSCYWGQKTAPDDAYLAMVGGEFIAHGAQQEATMMSLGASKPATGRRFKTSQLGSCLVM